jgi:site-specific DNA recombinase
MAGREQKAKEGKWNGGFAPYGYKLENGQLLIADDEVEVIRIIFDRYIHTNSGIRGVATYLNDKCHLFLLINRQLMYSFSLLSIL